MWWNGRFTSWMCSRQICSNCVMLSCQYGPKSRKNVSNTLLNLCHEEFRQLWGQKGVQPGTSKVYLIKWTVSVYIHTINVIVNSYWCCWKINMTYFLGGKAMAMFIRLFNLLFFYKVILLSVPIHFHWMNKNSFEILPVTSTFVFHTRRQS